MRPGLGRSDQRSQPCAVRPSPLGTGRRVLSRFRLRQLAHRTGERGEASVRMGEMYSTSLRNADFVRQVCICSLAPSEPSGQPASVAVHEFMLVLGECGYLCVEKRLCTPLAAFSAPSERPSRTRGRIGRRRRNQIGSEPTLLAFSPAVRCACECRGGQRPGDQRYSHRSCRKLEILETPPSLFLPCARAVAS